MYYEIDKKQHKMLIESVINVKHVVRTRKVSESHVSIGNY